MRDPIWKIGILIMTPASRRPLTRKQYYDIDIAARAHDLAVQPDVKFRCYSAAGKPERFP
jgi:hypothetical protein